MVNLHVPSDMIAAIREQIGVSRAVLGQLLGVPEEAVAHWEHGMASPDQATRIFLLAIKWKLDCGASRPNIGRELAGSVASGNVRGGLEKLARSVFGEKYRSEMTVHGLTQNEWYRGLVTKSPLGPLLHCIGPTILLVAPEQRERIEEWLPQIKFEFDFDHDGGSPMSAITSASTRCIRIRVKSLERIWAHCYSHLVFWEVVRRVWRNRIIDLAGEPDAQEARALLKWATEGDLNVRARTSQPEWPAGVPRPLDAAEKNSREYAADELFLMTIGFILWHEMSHLTLGHIDQSPGSGTRVPPDIAKQLECEADVAAATWLLELVQPNNPKYTKRLLGIAMGLSWIATHEVYEQRPSDSHPWPHDRLYNIMARFVPDRNHGVWAFVLNILKIHIDNLPDSQRIDYDPDKELDSFRSAVDYFVDILSRKAHEVEN